MRFIIVSQITTLLLLPLAFSISAIDWLNQNNFGDLSESINLGKKQASAILEQIQPGHNYSLVLPTNEAWKLQPKLKKFLNDKLNKDSPVSSNDPIYKLMFFITAETQGKIMSPSDIDTQSLFTLYGNEIEHKEKNGKHYLYFVEYDNNGERKRLDNEHEIEVQPKPIAVLDDVTIFGANEFKLPKQFLEELGYVE